MPSDIKRKPLPSPPPYDDTGVSCGVVTAPPNLHPPSRATVPAHTLPRYSSHSDLKSPDLSLPPVRRAATHIPPPTASSPGPSPTAPSGPSTVQKAYGEARHFLGGLITHPTESNKHYTILRHSHGVIFYRGSTTSVAVSIFSDSTLPTDRTLWLQNKGWTGKTGMRTKALLRLTNDWLNVTPSMPLRADQVPPADERAWQRDIDKFRRKNTSGRTRTHSLRETVVSRIPAEAGDGYFQLVLCAGPKKKVLCTSPVFRVLSTSMKPSSIRGASLSTLPLEMGAMVMEIYAQATVNRVIGPVSSAIESRIEPLQPVGIKQAATKGAFSTSGVGNRVAEWVKNGSGERTAPPPMRGQFQTMESFDLGPEPPFPIDFKSRAIPQGEKELDVRFSLAKIPDSIIHQLHGFFFGWARCVDPLDQQAQWHPAIVSIRNMDPSQQTRVTISHTMMKTCTLRLLDADRPLTQPQTQAQFQPKFQIRIMGFLRPDIPPPIRGTEKDLASREEATETAYLAEVWDASYAQAALDHPAWAPGIGSAPSPENASWIDRTREGYQSTRIRGQKMVENVPLHLLGIRSAAAEMRDKQVAVSGFYIVR
ncbi:hypothetical protein EYZ11_011803 [Aspergillus tanneri]|uniref:LipA and NB-ARC domain protein n=1 Tax=Aspergillus tanneri TaxID=1220188 RepID=A0A4S3J1V4_9EURO|nr:uncharacterized protein ATNIH1004_006841 [Aspergillus tanneri]KAA8645422.1 hypothetical protein ATNIH1004_006841 [Aspergillus tanneri]THC88753.1 hypothetical protein EYZ11_011803 [Aspergillus tanneri]